nr:DUF3352 domain-containing protein [Bacteroides sp. 224]
MACIIYFIVHVFVLPDQKIKQIYLIPDDAAFVIQTSDPIGAWKKFSNSPTWLCLKKSSSIQEVTTQVDELDSIVKSNKILLSLVGERDMLISIHKVKPTEWDFLIVVDLQKVSKISLLKDQMDAIFEVAGYTVTQRKYNGVDIMELLDPETRDTFYMAFVGNHVVVSYTSKLVSASIDSSKKETFEPDESYLEAEKMVAGKGLLQIFLNYRNLPQFMSIYLGGSNEYVDLFSHSMKYAGLYFDTNKDKIEVKGYTLRKDTADPYITALLSSGKHKMRAHEIMSGRTAFYTNIGFSNPLTFIKELENTLSITDKAKFDSYQSSRKKIESLFGLSLEEHFLSWMSGEFAMSQSEAGLLGREPELILAVRAKSIKDARKSMAFIEEKVRKRTPIKIKSVEYKGFEVNYLEMKGFFRLFFGGLFDKFEKPYYTYIDDYVVFSNKASSLLSFIEDYEQKNLLKNSEGFKKAYSSFESNSTLFVYSDIHKFYPQLQPILNRATWTDLQSNKDILYSFPHWTMQIIGDGHSASLQYVMDYKEYEPQQNVEPEIGDEEDKSMNEDAETEKELMTELKRFYVEKFAGNVLREFYPEGALKSESEVKSGKRHGRYREYYEDGTLKVRGKYAANKPKGTWKYYTEEGKFERKEKY